MNQTRKIKLVHILTVPISLRFLEGQISYMQQHGYEISVITSPGPLLDQFAEQQDVKVYGIEMPRRITPINDLIAILHIVRVLLKIKPDIVHSHTPKGGLLGTISAWIARISTRIYHARGLPFEAATGNKRRLLMLTEKVSCTLAHRVFCNSQSNLEIITQERLCSPEKIKVLHHGSSNGVDAIDLFKPYDTDEMRQTMRHKHSIPENAIVIGFVGRIVHDKGIDELIQAWHKIKDVTSTVHLLLVGPFEPQDPILPETKETIETDERIHFASFIKDKRDMPTVYSMMDIIVLPSHREGLPNVSLEAAGMAIPVVSTLASGCRDAVVHGETGILVPVEDKDALAGALQAYLDNPELRREHGNTGRARVLRDFRPEDIWQAQLDEYQLLNISKQGLHLSKVN